jgi:hypothetical protein
MNKDKAMEEKFKDAQEARPSHGDYLILMGLMRGKKFRKPFIQKWFKKFVPKDDYDPKDAKKLIEDLNKASNQESAVAK